MTKLKVIRQGCKEFDETTWLNWMMVQVPEDWTDAHVKEIIDWYPMYGGPGQFFGHEVIIRKVGKRGYRLVMQHGGLDI